ncbi:IPT/TIG domain-containing protein [Cavenderia fasciculata]|uniref:IPT/TIG domain-containing protein n=1 Tax=Cavenderia fasciculata TaxID=261658 RepID=F4PH68_CACFS|nr:IPT/TIG domain-containing protein [Cavenderia fasciculata]EGG25052.1 IPT/TIG domain-containing protein [Cavenderia fasciculata]|eukprot:XP_004362903.1 IPT/TIG domain-containing protein [Cavenderia fasciculata]
MFITTTKKSILFISTVIVLLGCLNGALAGYVWSTNGHMYDVGSTGATSSELARRACQNNYWDDSNGNRLWGYLATITTKAEMDFLVARSLVSNVWVSGSDDKEQGIWRYSSGPESGEVMYDVFNEKCYTYCPLSSAFSFADGNGLLASSAGTYTNEPAASTVYGVLCEYGGLETKLGSPRMVPLTVPTEGGFVKLLGLATGYLIDSVVVSVATPGFATYNAKCNRVTSVSTECYINPGNGGAITIATIGDTGSGSIATAYEPPQVSAVYPAYTSGSLITLVGSNFGTSASLISVTIGSTNIACNTVTMLEAHNVIRCTLASNLGSNKFLPITVTLNGQTRKFFHPATYFASANIFLKGFTIPMISDYAFKRLENKFQLFGQTGGIATVFSADMQTHLINTLPTPSSAYKLWQNYYSVNNGLVHLVGNVLGAVPQLYSSSSIPQGSSYLRYLFTLSNGQVDNVSPDSLGYAVLGFSENFEFIKNDKLHPYDDQSYVCPTTGCSINFLAKNYGLWNSALVFNAMGVDTTNFDRNQNSIMLTLPAGYGTNLPIKAYVDGKSSYNTLLYSYAAPIINSVVVSNGYVTITGTNFYTLNSIISVTVGSVSCASPTLISLHTVVRCIAPADATQATRLTIAGNEGAIQSNLVIPTLGNPRVTSVSAASVFGGVISINGYNYFSTVADISVTVGGVACPSVAIVTANTQITCVAPASAGSKVVVVTVSTRVSNSDISVVFQSPTITSVTQTASNAISIVGNGFGTNAAVLTITLGASSISSALCTAAGSSLTCTGLPTNLVNGLVSVSGSNTIPFKFNPTITSTTLSASPQSQVTIIGNHFDSGVVPTFGGAAIPCTGTYTQLVCIFVADSVSGSLFVTPSVSTPIVFDPFFTAMNPTTDVPTAGSTVIVQGGHFENHSGYTLSVLLQGTVPMTFTKLGLGFLSVVIPAGSGNNKYFVVKVNSKTTANIAFNYAGPSITSTKTSGEQLAIIGDNFGLSPTVTIGGTSASVLSATSNTILVTIPANAGQTDLIVVSSNGQSASYTGLTLHPLITSVSPLRAGGSSVVTVTSAYAPPSASPSIYISSAPPVPLTIVSATSPYKYSFNAPSSCFTGRLVSLSLGSSSISSVGIINSLQPSITSVSNPPFQIISPITITGVNLPASGISLIYVSDTRYKCNDIQYISDTTITCSFDGLNLHHPYQTISPVYGDPPLTIYMEGPCTTISANVFKYQPISITNVIPMYNSIEIKGTGFIFKVTGPVVTIDDPTSTPLPDCSYTTTTVTCPMTYQLMTPYVIYLEGGPYRAIYE